MTAKHGKFLPVIFELKKKRHGVVTSPGSETSEKDGHRNSISQLNFSPNNGQGFAGILGRGAEIYKLC